MSIFKKKKQADLDAQADADFAKEYNELVVKHKRCLKALLTSTETSISAQLVIAKVDDKK